MLSQVLFGEKYTVLDTSGNWMKVETIFDKYQGWLDRDHLQHTASTDNSAGHVLNRSLACFKKDQSRVVLEPGCEIYNPDFTNKHFASGADIYYTCDEFNESFITPAGSMTDTALKFINSPYIWGGRIPSGIDCSGFCQLVYKIHSVSIPRDSYVQVNAGEAIDFIDNAIPGDLVFFDNERGRITHVGMILAKGLVIHASGRVRIDTIDHQGIFKREINGYSHKLRAIRRIVT
jgi:cell wall-associated NlpC family hydrolase